MKDFEQQYYRHRAQRPQAEAAIDKTATLFTVAFSWGEISPVEKINDSLKSYYFASKNDLEVTSPFEILPSLTPLANKIRTGLLIANGAVYSGYNSRAFAAGCEFLCIATENRELVVGQVGGPSVILTRNKENILLSCTNDIYFGQTEPMPANLIGIENMCYPQINSFRFEQGDQLTLISRGFLPHSLLGLNLAISMQVITKTISEENSTIPFWIGRFNL
jgi:hypothetical protein